MDPSVDVHAALADARAALCSLSRCPACGVEVKRTGKRGRPRKLCEGCRAKTYDSEFCLHCGERLPSNRNSQRVYCSQRCGNTAWVQAHRAELKAQQERQS